MTFIQLAVRELLTREEFEAWLATHHITVPPTARIEKCRCGDVNCHGWRLVR